MERFPKADTGSEVLNETDSIVADGPIAATALGQFGWNAALVSNSVGDDSSGTELLSILRRHGVATKVKAAPGVSTPRTTVVTDSAGTRTWFAKIPDAIRELHEVDLAMMRKARLNYIDLYPILEEPALRAIRTSGESRTPLFLNIGERSVSRKLMSRVKSASKGCVELVQLSARRQTVKKTLELARATLDVLGAKLAMVTLASRGAIALTTESVVRSPAYRVEVVDANGAGAAFTAGFLHGYWKDWELAKCLHFACAVGTLNCTKDTGFDHFREEVVDSFIRANTRNETSLTRP